MATLSARTTRETPRASVARHLEDRINPIFGHVGQVLVWCPENALTQYQEPDFGYKHGQGSASHAAGVAPALQGGFGHNTDVLVVWVLLDQIMVQKFLEDPPASWRRCTSSTDKNIAQIRGASWQIDSGASRT